MSAVSRVSRHFHTTRAGGSLTGDGAVLRWLPLNSSERSNSAAMPSVVKKEVKTFKKPDPDVSTIKGTQLARKLSTAQTHPRSDSGVYCMMLWS